MSAFIAPAGRRPHFALDAPGSPFATLCTCDVGTDHPPLGADFIADMAAMSGLGHDAPAAKP